MINAGVGLILRTPKPQEVKQLRRLLSSSSTVSKPPFVDRSTESLRYMQQVRRCLPTILSAIPSLLPVTTELASHAWTRGGLILVSLSVYLLVYSEILRDGYRILLQEAFLTTRKATNSKSATLKYRPIWGIFGTITLLCTWAGTSPGLEKFLDYLARSRAPLPHHHQHPERSEEK